ncbi:MAG TPA: hypothetical protein VEM58_13950, partial [Streptosporangiaceae bacterium]|nr:hypothetical protein [Streptosporangiaceae bacterium]
MALGTLAALILVASAVADGKRPAAAPPAAVRRTSAAPGTFRQPPADSPADSALMHRGLLLMTAAVRACRTVPYRGVQIVAWSSPEGSSSYLLDVWHR